MKDQATKPQPTRQEITQSCLRVLAGLLTVPAILLLITALGLTHWQLTWLNPGLLKSIPVRHKFYQQLPGVILDSVLEEAVFSAEEQQQFVSFQATVGREPLKALVAAFIPPAWVQEQVERNIDSVFAYLDGQTPYPYLLVDITSLRERGISGEIQSALRAVLAALPACQRDYDFFREDIPQCRPSEVALEEMLDEIAINLDHAYPPDFSYQDVIQNNDQRAQMLSDFETARRVYQILTWSTLAAWLAYLFLMAFIILVFVRSLDTFLLWIGWPTLVGSGIAAVKFGTLLLIPALIKYLSAQLPPDMPEAMMTYLAAVINAFNLDIQMLGLLLSAGLAFLSMLALVGAFLIRRFQIGV